MVLKVILDHLVRDIPRAPYPISNGPKVPAPVFLGKCREFFLKTARGPALEAFHKIAHLLGGTILDMYVHVVLAYHTLKDTDIFRITDLLDKITAPDLHIPLENVVPIFGDPYYMGGQPRYRMAGPSLIVSHITNIGKCVATESLALKCIVSTNDCDQ
jgi:hypothetical protein